MLILTDWVDGWFFPPKPNRTIKKNKTTNKTWTDQNIKLKPSPSLVSSILFLSQKVQVSWRLAEWDQLQHNQLCNYRGVITFALSWLQSYILTFSCRLHSIPRMTSTLTTWPITSMRCFASLHQMFRYNWWKNNALVFVLSHNNICLVWFAWLFDCIFGSHSYIFIRPRYTWVRSMGPSVSNSVQHLVETSYASYASNMQIM